MRQTRYEETSKHYVLNAADDKMTNQELIDLLGEKEDISEKLLDRTNKLIDDMMKLLEITKGEKEDLVKRITEAKLNNIT